MFAIATGTMKLITNSRPKPTTDIPLIRFSDKEESIREPAPGTVSRGRMAPQIPKIIKIQGINEYMKRTVNTFNPSTNMVFQSSNSGSSDESSMVDLMILKIYPSTRNPGMIRVDKMINIPRIRTFLKLVNGYFNAFEVISPASILSPY